MKRIVVTGSECTGKTTLAEALAAYYGTLWVPEYARRFVAEKHGPVEAADVDAIARGQIALEEEMTAAVVMRPDHGLLIQDTDLLSTIVYSRHYYGACPEWIETEFRRRRADLYLLAGSDVPWMPDGDQRDRGDRRGEIQALFSQALTDRGCRSVDVQGLLELRIELAVREIEWAALRLPRGAG